MAVITVTIQDEPNGLVSFHAEADPVISLEDEEERTPAQDFALAVVDFTVKHASKIHQFSVDGENMLQIPELN